MRWASAARSSPAAALNALLPLISKQYEQMDEERRGVVRSMQMLADEARSFTSGLAGADAGQLRAILDHIKDVVITVDRRWRHLACSIPPASSCSAIRRPN